MELKNFDQIVERAKQSFRKQRAVVEELFASVKAPEMR